MPAVLIELGHRLLGVAVIALNHRTAADADLAGLACRQFVALLIGDIDFDPRRCPAGRGQAFDRLGTVGAVIGLAQQADDHRRLGRGIGLDEDRPEAVEQVLELGRAHRRGAIEQCAQ